MFEHPDFLEDSNRCANPTLSDLIDPARREWVRQALRWTALSCLPVAGCAGLPPALVGSRRLGFTSIAPSKADQIRLPPGYHAQVLAAWGEPVGIHGAMPEFREDASNSAAEQALQLGMHHDGIQFFALSDSHHGLLVMNHEYTDDGLLHPGGMQPWTPEKVHKAQAAHGISVIEVRWHARRWHVVRPSPHARRITANTPCTVSGPAAGHALLRTMADPQGRTVLGTLNNCASGKTPWGTYLSGEENFRFYFSGGTQPSAPQRRWGIMATAWFRWPEHDARFDATQHPHEFNRFGWIVEVDPMDPTSPPVKRTALGRGAHEGAWVATTRDHRAVVYSGEDARFEYLYKFVSRDAIAPAHAGLTQSQANRSLLDHGTLYVARFNANGTGEWLALTHGHGPLTRRHGFADQGEVLINSRQASDLLGATKMDRPEWIAIDQASHQVFCSLTNNSDRGQPGYPQVDPANPRQHNVMGHLIRWREQGDFDSTRFEWSTLVLAGDPGNARAEARGNVQGDPFASPDGLMLDARGVLWIQTDTAASDLNQGEFSRLGNNQMLACDPATGEVRRFMTGPVNCEITGATLTPDGCTLFVNIQHPGEPPSERSDPQAVNAHSRWPHGTRPRSATVAIRREDGGPIGT